MFLLLCPAVIRCSRPSALNRLPLIDLNIVTSNGFGLVDLGGREPLFGLVFHIKDVRSPRVTSLLAGFECPPLGLTTVRAVGGGAWMSRHPQSNPQGADDDDDDDDDNDRDDGVVVIL